MGVYDSVMVPCPRCGTRVEFQSKSGDCILATYELSDAPNNVLADANRHSPHTCSSCGVGFRLSIQVVAIPVLET